MLRSMSILSILSVSINTMLVSHVGLRKTPVAADLGTVILTTTPMRLRASLSALLRHLHASAMP